MSKLEYTIAVFGINHVAPCFAVRRCVQAWVLLVVLICCGFAHGAQEKIYRTGLQANKGSFSVSPDGRRLVFETGLLAHGMRLLDLGSGKITILPAEAERTFRWPSWSPDGQQIVVVSTIVRDKHYLVEDMQIALLDLATWQRRIVATGEGVKFAPFFSADAKTVYYFKGKMRESGRTIASRYDLFAIDLNSCQEKKLTNEAFYEVGKGDDDLKTVLFSGISNSEKWFKDALGREGRSAMLLYDKATGSVSRIKIDQSSGVFIFDSPRRDKAGNLYFVAAKARPGGGNYLWFLFTSPANGNNPVALTELPIDFGFDIAKNTGEIYVMDRDGEELIIRKLAATAAH